MSLLPSSPPPPRRRNWRTRYVSRPRNREISRPRRRSLALARSRARARDRAPRPRAFPTPRHASFSQPSSLTVTLDSLLRIPRTEPRGVRRGSPEQGQGEEAREAPLDADRDHGRGGAGETGEESGEESGEGACIPTHSETRRLPSQHETPEASRAISRDFYPSALGSFSRLARSRASLRGRKREPLFSRAAALTDSSASLSRPPPVARAGSQG